VAPPCFESGVPLGETTSLGGCDPGWAVTFSFVSHIDGECDNCRNLRLNATYLRCPEIYAEYGTKVHSDF